VLGQIPTKLITIYMIQLALLLWELMLSTLEDLMVLLVSSLVPPIIHLIPSQSSHGTILCLLDGEDLNIGVCFSQEIDIGTLMAP